MGRGRAVLLVLLLAAGCGGEDQPGVDLAEVVDVVERARDHYVAGRDAQACALMTAHGRERATRNGTTYVDDPARPRTCEAALRASRSSDDLDYARRATFELDGFEGRTARVRAHAGYDEATIELRRTDAGWRLHDATFVHDGRD